MSTIPAKSQYLLLLRNTELEKRLTLDEMEEAMRQFNAWLDRWKEAGAIKGGQPLAGKGKTISGPKERAMADGPFPESKEAVGGYILVEAESFEEAVKIASEWPLLAYDAFVEVRPVLEHCVPMQMVGERLAAAGAEH